MPGMCDNSTAQQPRTSGGVTPQSPGEAPPPASAQSTTSSGQGGMCNAQPGSSSTGGTGGGMCGPYAKQEPQAPAPPSNAYSPVGTPPRGARPMSSGVWM